MVAGTCSGMVVQTDQGATSHVASLPDWQPEVPLLHLEGKIVEVIIWLFWKNIVSLSLI